MYNVTIQLLYILYRSSVQLFPCKLPSRPSVLQQLLDRGCVSLKLSPDQIEAKLITLSISRRKEVRGAIYIRDLTFLTLSAQQVNS